MFSLTWLSNTTFVNKTPKVTWCLLMALSMAFLLRILWLQDHPEIEEQLRFVPYRLISAIHSHDPQLWLSAGLSLVSHMFLHDGRTLLHLLGNMLGLMALGPAVEARLGGMRFFALYMVAGITSALGHALVNPYDLIPLVGASGAVFGVGAAYMVLWWKDGRVFSLIMLFDWLPLPVSLWAPVAIALRLAPEIFSIVFPREGDLAAHWVHVGGFLTGLYIGLLYSMGILGKHLPVPTHRQIHVPDTWDLLKYIGNRWLRLSGRA